MDSDVLALLIPIVAILIGGLILLVPIAALALRFAGKPVVEAFARAREAQGGSSRELTLLRDRIALLEQRLDAVEDGLGHIGQTEEFDRALEAPAPERSAPRPGGAGPGAAGEGGPGGAGAGGTGGSPPF